MTNENASPACHDFAISKHKQRVNVKKEIQIFIFIFVALYENEKIRSEARACATGFAVCQPPASGCALSFSISLSKVNRNPPKKPMAKFLLRANPPPISFIVDESVLANVKGLDHEALRKAFSGECDTSRCLKELSPAFKDALLAIGGPESASLLAVPPNSCSTPLLQSGQSVRVKQIRIFSFKA